MVAGDRHPISHSAVVGVNRSERLSAGPEQCDDLSVMPFALTPPTEEELATPPPTPTLEDMAKGAYDRGDTLFQCAMELANQHGRTYFLGGKTVRTEVTEANQVLNAVAKQGWDLLSASVVFVPSEQDARGKAFQGHETAVSGHTVGYYVWCRTHAARH
jgi:hypothetical protein